MLSFETKVMSIILFHKTDIVSFHIFLTKFPQMENTPLYYTKIHPLSGLLNYFLNNLQFSLWIISHPLHESRFFFHQACLNYFHKDIQKLRQNSRTMHHFQM